MRFNAAASTWAALGQPPFLFRVSFYCKKLQEVFPWSPGLTSSPFYSSSPLLLFFSYSPLLLFSSSPPLLLSSSPGPGNQALGGLFIGALYSVTNQSELFANNIGAVINCAHDLSAYPSYHRAVKTIKQNLGVTFARLLWADTPEQVLEVGDVKSAVQMIHSTRCAGVSVLVHCVMGVSRSAALAVAYMVASSKKSVDECVAELRSRREQAMPNEGFLRQLREMEGELKGMELPALAAEGAILAAAAAAAVAVAPAAVAAAAPVSAAAPPAAAAPAAAPASAALPVSAEEQAVAASEEAAVAENPVEAAALK